ncbi:MAG: aspartate aminotransferase family protein [Chitinophagales bacterium]
MHRLFPDHIAKTSESPLMLEIERADGCYLFDVHGKKYLDLISGIAVSNIGHNNENVKHAIKGQLDKYMHVMVYGEFIESPQVEYATWLCENLPSNLNTVYFLNSGSEAVEGALKVAKRFSGRSEIISFKNSYHGSTMGALSAGNNEERKNTFRPLIPDNRILGYNDFVQIDLITEKTAAVLIELVQAEAGILLPKENYLSAIRKKCTESGALLIVDECQTGFGRTGNLFALQTFQIVPDILILGKALGGGMPLGAFISSKEIMHVLAHGPMLGHISTFGGHPVCCTAGLAAAKELMNLDLISVVKNKAALFNKLLVHKEIIETRSCGLLIAIELASEEFNFSLNKKLLERGLLTDWFLFNSKSLRLAPPLIISETEIEYACKIIIEELGN